MAECALRHVSGRFALVLGSLKQEYTDEHPRTQWPWNGRSSPRFLARTVAILETIQVMLFILLSVVWFGMSFK